LFQVNSDGAKLGQDVWLRLVMPGEARLGQLFQVNSGYASLG